MTNDFKYTFDLLNRSISASNESGIDKDLAIKLISDSDITFEGAFDFFKKKAPKMIELSYKNVSDNLKDVIKSLDNHKRMISKLQSKQVLDMEYFYKMVSDYENDDGSITEDFSNNLFLRVYDLYYGLRYKEYNENKIDIKDLIKAFNYFRFDSTTEIQQSNELSAIWDSEIHEEKFILYHAMNIVTLIVYDKFNYSIDIKDDSYHSDFIWLTLNELHGPDILDIDKIKKLLSTIDKNKIKDIIKNIVDSINNDLKNAKELITVINEAEKKSQVIWDDIKDKIDKKEHESYVDKKYKEYLTIYNKVYFEVVTVSLNDKYLYSNVYNSAIDLLVKA